MSSTPHRKAYISFGQLPAECSHALSAALLNLWVSAGAHKTAPQRWLT